MHECGNRWVVYERLYEVHIEISKSPHRKKIMSKREKLIPLVGEGKKGRLKMTLQGLLFLHKYSICNTI